jgi:hypothetical protein
MQPIFGRFFAALFAPGGGLLRVHNLKDFWRRASPNPA